MVHPAERFIAPSTITRGSPLKDLLDARAVDLIAESLALAIPGFVRKDFIRQAGDGLNALELKPRAAHIATAMAAQFDADPRVAATQFIASLGPKLGATAGFGLKPFFYLPHASFIHGHLRDWEAGIAANYALTTRFTAEFSIRPFLVREQDRTLARLAEWVADPDPHVRRLVSEGTRPRLPWAEHLSAFIADPAPVLPLLDLLVDDGDLYVRRSVANHLGDIAKDHPELAFSVCRRWLKQASPGRAWTVRHAVRHPAKHGVAAALALRRRAGGR